jgi:hypothetical protein
VGQSGFYDRAKSVASIVEPGLLQVLPKGPSLALQVFMVITSFTTRLGR